MVDIQNGKIHSCDDRSGHFKPLLFVCVRNKFFITLSPFLSPTLIAYIYYKKVSNKAAKSEH